MATFEEHCQDCFRLLGDRHERVNAWLDREFSKRGSDHRRILHHTRGVEEVDGMWGREAAKAAIVHIVRDCGQVPRERDYYRTYSPCIEIAPAYMAEGKLVGLSWDAFRAGAASEIKRIFGE